MRLFKPFLLSLLAAWAAYGSDISQPAGGGSVGPGTAGTLPLFNTATTLADSSVTDLGGVVRSANTFFSEPPGPGQAFRTRIFGDAFARWSVDANGEIDWGTGGAAADTFLRRSALGTLECNCYLDMTGGDNLILLLHQNTLNNDVLATSVGADTGFRFDLKASGSLLWGDGTNPVPDLRMDRCAVTCLQLAANPGGAFARFEPAGATLTGTNAALLMQGPGGHAVVMDGSSQARMGVDSSGMFLTADTLGTALHFYTNPGALVERVTIDNGGNVLLLSGAVKLQDTTLERVAPGELSVSVGNFRVQNLAAAGNAFACLDAAGKFFRSATPCAP